MTNYRQITVHHLDSSRHDRQFHPYRRPTGYVRFSSIPQMSAERQYLMTFMMVSKRDVTGTSSNPLSALGLWSQKEATCRILSRFSYCYIVRRDRRYHPYKRPGNCFNRQCRRGCLPFYLNYRYFSASVQKYLHDTAANTAVKKETEVEFLSRDNTIVDAQTTHNVPIAMLKSPEMTTPELDIVTSVDVSYSVETDPPVEDSLTNVEINLLTDSDLQQKREWEGKTYVKDTSSPAQSKTITDFSVTCFDNKQDTNETPGDHFATTNVPRSEVRGLKKVSEQVTISAQEIETAGASQIDVKQPRHEETDYEDNLLKIDPDDDDVCDSALCLSESSINQLLDTDKRIDADFEPKQSIMEENPVDSDELLSTSKPTVTRDVEDSIREPEVNVDLGTESKSIRDRHEDQPETKFNPEKTQEVSSDDIATVKDKKEQSRESEKENATLTIDGKASSNAVAVSDDNQRCDTKTDSATGNLQSNFIDCHANSDMMTSVSVSAKAPIKIENKSEQLSSQCRQTKKNNGFIFDKLQEIKKDKNTLESDTKTVITHNTPKVPRIMYINPAMIAQLTTQDNKCEKYRNVVFSKDNPSTKHTITTSGYTGTSSKRIIYLNPSKQSKPTSSKKETGLLLNGQCENPTVTPTELSHDSNKNFVKKTTIELCDGKTREKQIRNKLRQTKDNADSTERLILSLNPSKNRQSAAVFFSKEMENHSETSNISVCTDDNTASSSARRIICLSPNKKKSLNSSKPQVTDPIKTTHQELHSDNSLSMWLRHGSVSSDPNKSRQKLSDEERLKLRKRRFGTTSSNHQQTSMDSVTPVINKRRIIRLNRR